MKKQQSLWDAGAGGLVLFTILSVAFFVLPIYVMVITSLKDISEIAGGSIFALPRDPSFDAWVTAWSRACTGLNCEGLRVGFWNSVRILVPSVVLSVSLGAVTGYALAFWRPRGAEVLFATLMVGAFMPYQLFIYPLAFSFAAVGLANSLAGIVLVHVIFGLPIMTLMFRNYYAALPFDLLKAARIDGAGFWRIFLSIMLPMSTPMIVVAVILQTTGVWNDYLFGLIFAGPDNQPMTVQLNAVVNTVLGDRPYNVHMAATILTAAVPLIVYFLSGRWFVRGIAAGAVKG